MCSFSQRLLYFRWYINTIHFLYFFFSFFLFISLLDNLHQQFLSYYTSSLDYLLCLSCKICAMIYTYMYLWVIPWIVFLWTAFLPPDFWNLYCVWILVKNKAFATLVSQLVITWVKHPCFFYIFFLASSFNTVKAGFQLLNMPSSVSDHNFVFSEVISFGRFWGCLYPCLYWVHSNLGAFLYYSVSLLLLLFFSKICNHKHSEGRRAQRGLLTVLSKVRFSSFH